MATIYVDSNATGGSNTGVDWTNAYLTLESGLSDWSAGSSDVIWMASDHFETFAAQKTYNWTGNNNEPTLIYSVNSSTDAYEPATSVQIQVTAAANLRFDDAVAMFGLYLEAGTDFYPVGQVVYYLKDCTIKYSQQAHTTYGLYVGNPQGKYYIEDCTFIGHTSYICQRGIHIGSGDFVANNCTWTQGAISTIGSVIDRTTGGGAIYACDFSNLSYTSGADLVRVVGYGGYYEINNCKYNSSFPRTSSSNVGFSRTSNAVEAAFTADGASTAKLYDFAVETPYGDTTHTASIYRSGGFVDADGDTPIAHIMEPDSTSCDPTSFVLFGPELTGYYDSTGSVTFRVEALHNYSTAPTKDELWMDVYYLGTSNSTKWSRAGGRQIWSTSNWATSSATWSGDSGYSKIKLEESVTINKAGPWMVQLWLGKYESGKSVVYCPKVEID